MKIGKINLKLFTKENINKNYISWMNDEEIIKYLGREEYFKGFKLEDALTYYNEVSKNKNIKFYSINYDNKFIGTAKTMIINSNHRNKISEIGILIGDKKYWGKGIASKTIKLMTQYLFDNGSRKVIAGGFKDNSAMLKAFMNSGFKIEGTFRKSIFSQNRYYDHVYLGCFKNELNENY